MRSEKIQWPQNLLVAAAVTLVCACVPDSDGDQSQVPAVDEAKSQSPKFVSAMTATSDCGVVKMPESSNGFAGPVGTEISEMPENIAARVAVGADREPVDTDWDRVSPGYVIVEPSSLKQSFVIGNDKEVVATIGGEYYPSYTQLLPNGNRLVSSNGVPIGFTQGGGGKSGCIEEYAANGDLLWRINLNAEKYINHHDVIKLDNGNVLTLVWQKVSTDTAISQGRNPENVAENGEFWFEGIVEVNPYTLEIVWEWSVRHHLIQDFDIGKSNYGVVVEHPELLDINLFHRNGAGDVPADWTHANAMDYNAELDQIFVSFHSMGEVFVIDHSTTPRQSAGHSGGRYGKGGDFLYRWGNPENYGRGTAEDRILYSQHDVQWILPGLPGAGNVLVFNNGDADIRPYTIIMEFSPEMSADGSYVLQDGMPYGPKDTVWEYNPEPPERFYSWYISGAQRLPNGNTFINAGAIGKQREVTSEGDIVWEYAFKNEVEAPHTMFRANKYVPDYPGLVGLIPQGN